MIVSIESWPARWVRWVKGLFEMPVPRTAFVPVRVREDHAPPRGPGS